jgi:hypothetical protein
MARKLLDSVKSQLASPGGQQQVGGMEDRGERTQSLLRAKLGKAGGTGAAPRASAIKEKQAGQQTKMGLEQLKQAGKVQGEQLGQQQREVETKEAEATKNIESQLKDVQNRFKLQSEDILQDFERGPRS